MAMLTKGDIKLTLDGHYLKGRFALFQLRESEKGNEWLLVKKADEYALDSFEIESMVPVKPGASTRLPKTLKSGPDPFPDPLPAPMLAKLVASPPANPSWICEMKLDGYRILCSVKNRKVDLVSRNGNNYNKQFEALMDDLLKIEENLILDGEVVVEDQGGRSDFSLLQEYNISHRGILKYYVFDILYLGGHSVMRIPLASRKELLDALFDKYDFKRVIKLEYQVGNSRSLFEELSGKGYEGIIIKDPAGSYFPGKRSDSWLKVKAVRAQEAVICGYTLPQGSRKYFGSIILGLFDDDDLKYVGNCGTGFSDKSLRDLHKQFRKLETKTCPFPALPDLSGFKGKPVWLKPELVVSVKFMEWTSDEHLRCPFSLA